MSSPVHHPRIIVASLLLTLAGCVHSNELSFESETACLMNDVQSIAIDIEVARSSEQRQQGLMGRTTLGKTDGMLFVYKDKRPPSHTFWMRNTLIPLDIAFIDSSGTIRAINTMEPCSNDVLRCPTYPAGASFTLALEMNKGYFAQNGFAVGHRFALNDICQ
ncbi:MAG: DUF192 domain-containing protein [Marinobacter sp.]|uniref:DUF192 domain-containing protein n=1 Tax=Marinobacter sp. TaxID=50741 RepID=UPI0034A069BC